MKKLLSLLLSFIFVFACVSPALAKPASPDGILTAAGDILLAKKRSMGMKETDSLFSGDFLKLAGSTAGDWYAFGAGVLRLETGDEYARTLLACVRDAYETEEKLSRDKATEWHRISLCLSALGFDPAAIGTAGGQIDLISDGVLYRETIGRQGINGHIWGLITLAGSRQKEPPGAANTVASLMTHLFSRALPSGGWTLSGDTAETDLTAMALTALSLCEIPSAETEKLSLALSFLSSQQNPDGSFSLRGLPNCESTAWALVALCSLGIDYKTDPRFIKNGHTALEGLFSFRKPDGAFAHSLIPDENADALPGDTGDMASAQALLALAALFTYETESGNLFDFSSRDLKKADLGGENSPGTLKKAADRIWEKIKTAVSQEKTRKPFLSVFLFVIIGSGTLTLYRRRKRK